MASLKSCMVITIPANGKHWHGAKKDSWFSPIAIVGLGEETSNEWCEVVSDDGYNKLDKELRGFKWNILNLINISIIMNHAI